MHIGILDLYDLGNFEIDLKDFSETLNTGDYVVFKSEDGSEEIGQIIYVVTEETDAKKEVLSKSKFVRKATAHDIQKFESNKERGEEARKICETLSKKYNLTMAPFYGIYSLDGTKANVIFTADDRVDFRELVKDMAKQLQKQIHLKQIGPRDKAKIVGGFGRCGRKLCCKAFLPGLESVTMEMARVQGLEGKGSSKLSGACGKLLCCLKYEAEAYKKLRDSLPAIGSKVKLKKPVFGSHDDGVVVGMDVLNQKIRIDVGMKDLFTVGLDDIAKVLTKSISTAPAKEMVRREVKEKNDSAEQAGTFIETGVETNAEEESSN